MPPCRYPESPRNPNIGSTLRGGFSAEANMWLRPLVSKRPPSSVASTKCTILLVLLIHCQFLIASSLSCRCEPRYICESTGNYYLRRDRALCDKSSAFYLAVHGYTYSCPNFFARCDGCGLPPPGISRPKENFPVTVNERRCATSASRVALLSVLLVGTVVLLVLTVVFLHFEWRRIARRRSRRENAAATHVEAVREAEVPIAFSSQVGQSSAAPAEDVLVLYRPHASQQGSSGNGIGRFWSFLSTLGLPVSKASAEAPMHGATERREPRSSPKERCFKTPLFNLSGRRRKGSDASNSVAADVEAGGVRDCGDGSTVISEDDGLVSRENASPVSQQEEVQTRNSSAAQSPLPTDTSSLRPGSVFVLPDTDVRPVQNFHDASGG